MKSTAMIFLAIAAAGSSLMVPNDGIAQNLDPNKAEIAALKAQLEELRSVLPTQAHVMADVDYNFSNLWFAAQKENWPLANFYLSETRGRLNWALRLKPVRQLSTGQDVALAPLIKKMEQSSLMQLKDSIRLTDHKAFEKAYRLALSECHACHITIEKSFLRPHIPTSPATHIINMQPESKP